MIQSNIDFSMTGEGRELKMQSWGPNVMWYPEVLAGFF